MLEFVQLCFSPVNLVFTLLMVGVMGYWIMFCIGAVGLDFLDDLDIDLDGDVDVDVDIDADLDVDLEAELDTEIDTELDGGDGSSGSRAGWFISILKFMDVGDVPLMIMLTALISSLWAVSMICTRYFNPQQTLFWAGVFFLPDLIVSVLLTKVLTYPAAAVFKRANSGVEKRTKIIGRTCIVTTSKVTKSSGQAEIRIDNAAPITLNVRCRSDKQSLQRGDEALILELVEEKGTYIVVPFDLEVS